MKNLFIHLQYKLLLFIACTFFILFLGIQTSFSEDHSDGPVDILNAIEVPATAIIKKDRAILMPMPTTTNLSPLPKGIFIPSQDNFRITYKNKFSKLARDSVADIYGIRKPVKPAKAERPPYPQAARLNHWEGTVILRITVNHNGFVDKAKTRISSGFPILDKSALQAVKNWTFEPAKNGEFPVSSTVDLPIRFDLND